MFEDELEKLYDNDDCNQSSKQVDGNVVVPIGLFSKAFVCSSS